MDGRRSKTPRSLAASMEAVSEENHQHGSFAETEITGCHDSTLLQLGEKAQIIRQKKPTKLHAPLAAATWSEFEFGVR